MTFSGVSAKRRVRQLGEIIRIVELRVDAKREELESCRQTQQLREAEVQTQQRIFDEANQAVNACRASIVVARAATLAPGAIPGFIAAQKRLQKVAQAKRKQLKAAQEQLDQAKLLVAQALDELQSLRARHELLDNLSKGLKKQQMVHQNLLEDTLQDEDYASYLGGRAHKGRTANAGATEFAG